MQNNKMALVLMAKIFEISEKKDYLSSNLLPFLSIYGKRRRLLTDDDVTICDRRQLRRRDRECTSWWADCRRRWFNERDRTLSATTNNGTAADNPTDNSRWRWEFNFGTSEQLVIPFQRDHRNAWHRHHRRFGIGCRQGQSSGNGN